MHVVTVIVVIVMVMMVVVVIALGGVWSPYGKGFGSTQPTHGKRRDNRNGKRRAQKNFLQRRPPAFIDFIQ
jgi:hypothetical protein